MSGHSLSHIAAVSRGRVESSNMKIDLTVFSLKVFMLQRSDVKQLEFGSNFNGGGVCV